MREQQAQAQAEAQSHARCVAEQVAIERQIAETQRRQREQQEREQREQARVLAEQEKRRQEQQERDERMARALREDEEKRRLVSGQALGRILCFRACEPSRSCHVMVVGGRALRRSVVCALFALEVRITNKCARVFVLGGAV
jgi:phage-related minor tail protein